MLQHLTPRALVLLLVFVPVFVPLAGARTLPPSLPASLPTEVASHLDAFVLERMAAWATPGLSLVVVLEGEVVLSRGYGVADLVTGEPMSEDTLVMLGSTTKAMTALAVMQLAEAGKLELDAPVTRYLPWFGVADPRGADITLRHLLSHSSGFPWGTLFTGREQQEELAAYVRSLAGVRLEAGPGERYGYSNDTFTILGLIVQEVAGVPYESYMQDNVFGPLGMTRTTFDMALAERRGLAAGHRNEYGAAAPYSLPYTDSENPAGKLMTSSSDLGNYLIMLLGGGVFRGTRVLSERSLAEMWTPVVPADDGLSYGLAWYIGDFGATGFVTHPGSTGTSGSRFTLVPGAGLGVGVISNVSRPSDPREEITWSITLATLLFGDAPFEAPPTPEPVPLMIDPAVRAALVGEYGSAAGPVRIFEEGDRLLGSVAGYDFALEPMSDSLFVLRSDAERLDGLTLEFLPANPRAQDWLAGDDRLALMGQWFAFRSE
ncbi:N/A [soil metagenome]